MNKIRINQGRLINSPVRTLWTVAVISVIGYLMNAFNNQLGFAICLALSFSLLVVWTAFKVLEIDLSAKELTVSKLIMGRSMGRHKRVFDRVRGVEISELDKDADVYRAFLVLDENTKVFLISDEDKEDLLERLSPILKKLKTELRSS
jgi:hypothetical protein